MEHFTLFELDQKVEACFDPDSGELLEGMEETLNELLTNRETRYSMMEGLALKVKNIEAMSAAIGEQVKTFTKRKKALDNRAVSIRRFLELNLNGSDFNTPKVSIGWRKSESTVIDDEAGLIHWAEVKGYDYAIKWTKPEPKKDEIKKLLKGNVECPYAHIEIKKNMQLN